MKIGIDARLWNETGVGRYTRNLVRELSGIDKRNKYVLFLRKDEFEKVKLPGGNWEKRPADVGWHSLSEQLVMLKILKKENLDLVHFPYFNAPFFYNDPFVVTIHDLIFSHFPTGRATTLPWPVYRVKRFGYQRVLSHAVRKAEKIITVSEATRDEIIDHFSVKQSKIVVTYESGALAGGVGSKSTKNFFDFPYFLYVGNAHPHKNLERLLEAFKKIEDKKTKLVLVGKEDYFYRQLKSKVGKMGLEERIVFEGGISDGRLKGLYQHAKALILPSLMEGFGLPVLEAMSLGCLVLSSDIPALREICGESAVYFKPTKIEEMTERINEVSRDELENEQEMIEKGLVLSKMFSWQKLARQTLEVYQSAS